MRVRHDLKVLWEQATSSGVGIYFVYSPSSRHYMIVSRALIDNKAHALFEQAPALISILKGREGVCELFNPPMAKWWGNRQVIGVPMRQAWPELHGTGIFEIVEKVHDSNQTIYLNEFRAAWEKDGMQHEHFFNFVFAPYKDHGPDISIMIFGNEVTDIVIARRKVEESRKDLVQLADAMPQLVWMMDEHGNVSYYNKRIWEYAFGTGDQNNNKEFLANLLHPADLSETRRLLEHSLHSAKPFEYEHRLRMKGGEYKWHLTRAFPDITSTGKMTKWFATATDIHKQKVLESGLESLVAKRTDDLEKANQKLVESNDNLAQFAYVVSHDLQAPLRKVKSFVDLLKNKHLVNPSRSTVDILRRIQDAVERMRSLMDGILEYSKLSMQESTREKVDLNEVIQEVLADLELTIKSKQAMIEVGRLQPVQGNAVQFRQVFQNLISNALKFCRADFPPVIVIRSTIVPEEGTQCIHITDNGVGFNPDHAAKVFELFQRAHSQHEFEGTGIGLSIVKKIIEKHGGRIYAESCEGSGTTFSVILPLT